MPDEPLLDRLRRAPIRTIRVNRGGSTLSLRFEFQDGTRAAFKPRQIYVQSIPRKEIAAYRINRLLGLNRVPPAAARVISRQQLLSLMDPRDHTELVRVLAEARFLPDGHLPGQVSYWIPEIGDASLEEQRNRENWTRWLSLDGRIDERGGFLAEQVSNMIVFDFLINNADRFSGENTLADRALEHLYFLDNTMSFGANPRGHPNSRSSLMLVHRFSRRLVESLRALSEDSIRAELAGEPDPPFPLLLDKEVRGVLKRRDFIIDRVEALAAAHGIRRVLCFQ